MHHMLKWVLEVVRLNMELIQPSISLERMYLL